MVRHVRAMLQNAPWSGMHTPCFRMHHGQACTHPASECTMVRYAPQHSVQMAC